MNAMLNLTCPVEAGSRPYVGMRPYRREERNWFYGRSTDGRIIADKVLSARLTLLYAPSGVGKSSVLNANTMPALEAEDCCVMYFDAWAGSDPTAAIKDKLAVMASSIGVVDPLAGAPTIGELARLTTGNGKTLVLVFDQFEEFLVNHANALDPLRKEVAALVRVQTIDARVLISLREEFLAALEPFHQEVLTLFQSTYRLEPLAASDVRDAIVKPVLFFDGEVEPGLAERLIDDLSEGQKNVGETVDASSVTTREWFYNLCKRWFRRSAAPSAALEVGSGEPSVRAGVTRTIDLPMLQLVCEQMWRAAPKTDGIRKLTLALYKNLGGKDKILNDHIRSCMPARWRDRLFTAKLMRYLAPPSGMKLSYSAADLSAYSALDKMRVEAELLRLSGPDARILRKREYRHEVRYELQHDALVRHLAPWRDYVLEQASVLRWVKGVGLAAGVVIGLVALNNYVHNKEVRHNTDDRLVELRGMNEDERVKQAPASFENVADYLLRQEQGVSRLEHLKQLFEKHVDLLPADYATAASVDDVFALGHPGKGLFALRYSKDRMFDLNSFNLAWSEAAQRLTRRWGIPVPERIALVPDPGLTENQMVLESESRPPLSIDVEAFGANPAEKALLQMKNVAGPVNAFREHFMADWIRPRLLSSDDWWVVPRWSLPVWRAAGLSLYGVDAYPALALEAELQRDPTVLLTEAATIYLVKRVAAQYPCTAAETWKQRGFKLKDDLSTFVGGHRADQRWRPLTHLHLLFDLLASTTGDEEVRRLVLRSDSYVPTLEATRRGDWPLGGVAKADNCALPVGFGGDWDMTVFGDAWTLLPPLQPKLRLSLGADLVSAWSTGSEAAEEFISQRERHSIAVNQTWGTSKPSTASKAAEAKTASDHGPDQTIARSAVPALMDAFERLRREMYARNGIWLPDVSVVKAAIAFDEPRKHQFRIGLFDTPVSRLKLADAGGTNSDAIARVMAGLDAATSSATRAWIDAEFVGGLLGRDDAMKKLVKDWEMPSITDLTLLLREVVAGDQAGVMTPDGQGGRTIHDPVWLLRSLVFWKSYYLSGDPKNPPKDLLVDLARHLRRLEAKKVGFSETPSPSRAAAVLERGITALYADRYREAEQLFEQSFKLGARREVADTFAARYSARWGEGVRLRAQALCQVPKKDTRDEQERVGRYKPKAGLLNNPMLPVELQAWLEGQKLGPDPKEFRNLGLCLLSLMPETAKDELLLSTATRYGEPNEWPQAQAWWFTLELLRHYDPTKQESDLLKQGTRFMDSVVSRFEDDEAYTVFSELSTLCGEPGPKAWCWPLLRRFAQATDSPWVSLEVALILANRSVDAKDVQLWVDRAIELANKFRLSQAQLLRFDFFTTVAKLYSEMNLGMDVDQKVVFGLSQGDAAKTNPDLELSAALLAIDFSLRSEKLDHDRLLSLVEKGLEKWSKDPDFLSNAATAGLRMGNMKLVKSAVDEAYLQATSERWSPVERSQFWFIVSYAGLVTNHKEAIGTAVKFIHSKSVRFQPLVAMLLHLRTDSRERDLAHRRLNELWRTVDSQSWDARLRNGDDRVWHEMLLGYFKGAVSEADIFDPLRDDSTFRASKLAGLGFTRQEALTEANFYHALRRKVDNEADGARESLKRVVKLGTKHYIEYGLAEQLLRNDLNTP